MIHTKQKEKLMQILKCSEAEAIEIMTADKRIDRGEKLYELPDELKAGAKKARQADRKPTERKPREKKMDCEKRTLLTLLYESILPFCQSYEVTNPEREFLFTHNGKRYKVVLSCPRS